jgi:hypothetical protein
MNGGADPALALVLRAHTPLSVGIFRNSRNLM